MRSSSGRAVTRRPASRFVGHEAPFTVGLLIFTVSSLLDGLAWLESSLIVFRPRRALAPRSCRPRRFLDHLPRGPGAQPRARCLGCRLGKRWRGRRVAGRRPDQRLELVLDLLHGCAPAGILVLAVSPWLLKETRRPGHRHFDFAGAASITGGLMLLVYAPGGRARLGHDRDNRPVGRVSGADRRLPSDRGALDRTAAESTC